jgi:hypothetical protein
MNKQGQPQLWHWKVYTIPWPPVIKKTLGREGIYHMVLKFDYIKDAFEFVSSDLQFENSAILDKAPGKIYYSSEMSGSIPYFISSVEIVHTGDMTSPIMRASREFLKQ